MKKIFVFIFLPAALFAQNSNPLFDTYLQAQTDLYRFNGNVLVSKNGQVIYKKSFGYADFNSKRKLDSNSVFDIGSIAKEFTAMGILLLKDKGMISYTDTLRKFFPELPYLNITIQQLLTHTSGIPDGFGIVEFFFDHNKIATNNDLIRLLAREKPPVFFKPGEDMMYSGTGFNLLASIIEKVSGQPYKTYIAEQIFKPLGMKNTQVANEPRSAKKIPGYVNGFVFSDSIKSYTMADSMHTGWTSYLSGITGEGMILSTTADLLKWDRALKNHRLLTAETQQAMLVTQAEKRTFPFVHFGYGIRVGKNDLGNYIFHNGSFPGFTGMHICYIDDDVTVVVLSNNESHADFIADGLAAIFLNKNFIMFGAQKESTIKPALDEYIGKYKMPLTRPPYMVFFPAELVKNNNKLYLHTGGSKDKELQPISETMFVYTDGTDQQIEFEKDSSGKMIKAWHIAWGVKREIKKME